MPILDIRLDAQSSGGVTIGLYEGLDELASWDFEKSEIDDDIEDADLGQTIMNLLRIMHRDKSQGEVLLLLGTTGAVLTL